MNEIKVFNELKQTDYYKKLSRRINGALICAISSHGAISKKNVSSATKRIVSQILVDSQPELSNNEYYELFFDFYLNWCERLKIIRHHIKYSKDEEQIKNLKIKNKVIMKILNDFRNKSFKINNLRDNLISIYKEKKEKIVF